MDRWIAAVRNDVGAIVTSPDDLFSRSRLSTCLSFWLNSLISPLKSLFSAMLSRLFHLISRCLVRAC